MRPLILFVCRANICRSPTAVAVFRRYLRDRDLDGLVTLRSAGVEATRGAPWCEISRAAVGARAAADLDLADVTSKQLQANALGRADIVLAADGETRASVLRTQPAVRSRLFTVVEAALLARFVLDRANRASAGSSARLAGLVVPRPNTTDPHRGLIWLVSEMNAARGQLPTVQSRAAKRWRRKTGDQAPVWDIPDAHTGIGVTNHRLTLKPLLESVESLSASIVSLASPAIAT